MATIVGITPNTVVACPSCKKSVAATEQGSYEQFLSPEDGKIQYKLLACPECFAPFLLAYRPVEFPGGGLFGDEDLLFYPEPISLYPEPPDSLDASVPDEIAESYREAQRAFYKAAAYTAAAIMCRRTLEGICVEQGASGRGLSQKLDDLKKKELIDARVYEWANDVLRRLGNDAAHDYHQRISMEDAQDALSFTKALIEYVYVFTAAFENFKKRREHRTS